MTPRYSLADDIMPVLDYVLGAEVESPKKSASGEGFKIPDAISQGDRHDIIYRFLRSQKARGVGFEVALAGCLALNEQCEPPIPRKELEEYLRRVWTQADSPDFKKGSSSDDHGSDRFPTTEAGDAEFFAATYSDVLRYDHRRGRWLLFSGHRWVPQSNGEVHRLALQAIRARQKAATDISEDEVRRKRLKWALEGESRKRLSNLLALAQNVEPVADRGDTWDTDPWLLCVPNGVIDLSTGALREGRPEDRITMCASVHFDAAALCPLWDSTVEEIFDRDPELVGFFDRWAGYSATGDCREESLAFCWGDGANGKGTLMNTLAYVFGDYADDLPFSALELHDRGAIPNDIAKIVAKRFVTSSETGETARLNEARVKALTGRDPITARFLHKEFFTFQPMAKFWLATNQKPEVRDTSIGFWRRIHLIPFTQSFADRPNLRLKDDLRAEAAGILARVVRGCLAWQAEGLNPPIVVTEATNTYRNDSMPLTEFLDECCVIRAGARAAFGQLFDAYKRWGGNRRGLLNRRQFSDALHERFETDPNVSRNVTFVGLGLMTTENHPQGGM